MLSTGATCKHQPRSGPASRTSQNVTNNKLWHLDLHRMEPPGMPVWPASRALSYGFIVSCELDGWMSVSLLASSTFPTPFALLTTIWRFSTSTTRRSPGLSEPSLFSASPSLSFFASSSFQFTSYNKSAVQFSLFHLFS